ALGLIVLAFVLLILEIYVTSYGVLTLGGLAALISGSLFLFRTDDAYLHLSHSVIFSTVAAIACFVGLIAWVMVRDRLQKHETVFNSTVGHQATILEEVETGVYQVRVNGEVWRAFGQSGLASGAHVTITEQDDLKMQLKF